jgi:hypothetical protein
LKTGGTPQIVPRGTIANGFAIAGDRIKDLAQSTARAASALGLRARRSAQIPAVSWCNRESGRGLGAATGVPQRTVERIDGLVLKDDARKCKTEAGVHGLAHLNDIAEDAADKGDLRR